MQPQAHLLHSRFTSHINMDNQLYVHLISDDSINYFPSNEPWQFTCMLADVLILSGRWYVGLVEVEYSHKIKGNTRPFHIGLVIYVQILLLVTVNAMFLDTYRYRKRTVRKER